MKYELYQDKAKQWRWRLRAANGRIVCESGEGYRTRRGAELSIYRLESYPLSTLDIEY